MKIILAYIDTIERAKFYLRFDNCKFIYITDNVTVYIFLLLKKEIVYFIKHKNINQNQNKLLSNYLKNTIEIKLNNITMNEAILFYNIIGEKLIKIYNKYKIDYLFLWNGCKIGDFACADFAKKYNIKTFYFEVANIPGKLFVDQQGTNRKSSIFTNPEQLDFFDKENRYKYLKWKEEYLKTKFGNYVLPQSRYAKKIKRAISPVLNIITIKLGIGIHNDVYYKNLKRIFSSNIKVKLSSNVDYKREKYVLVPLQVSDDTQVMINSDVGLKELIDYSYKYAKENSMKLVIKPHPAEQDNSILNYIYSINDTDGIVITNDNTMKLIKYSNYVITINSTVGLEALILDKPVKFLGYSFYSKFDQNRLINYIISYLKNIDYFGNKSINCNDVVKNINLIRKN